jgi:predicted PolB exonuclease-like 3'-5' exonuclease
MAATASTEQYWAFDCEWVPDITAGRRVYRLPPDLPDDEVLRVMWCEGGATEDNPQPFLKTILCRLVSIAAVVRTVSGTNGVTLKLWSIPAIGESLVGEPQVTPEGVAEVDILNAFLGHFERRAPVLVGYNSRNADIHILLQRAFVNGLRLPGFFAESSAKPWNQHSIDLMDFLGGHGKSYSASLDEVANLCGIPGKLETTGHDVARLFYGGRSREIVEYNMFDALTTYLVWLRMEHFRGRFTDAEYAEEQERLRELLVAESEKPDGAYLKTYLDAWTTG